MTSVFQLRHMPLETWTILLRYKIMETVKHANLLNKADTRPVRTVAHTPIPCVSEISFRLATWTAHLNA
jgi:hypothetical protein